ncbi:MAG: protein kinase [Vicinamibacteria bacterium]|nr:protein kinase [Vicinamibacteria bacterium]
MLCSKSVEGALSDTPKKTFGKYEAISHLGSGAMGVVWRAQDPVLGRTVAIKTISAALGSDNENKERFLREARAAAQLNHPNIITVFDFGQADNELYMAMELLEGKDLKELITAGTLTFDQKLDIMEQVADGLAYAHGRDVIHRDLKPGNIHVQPNGQVKILDFGLARLGSSDLTKTGVVMGTPNYMSPEQVMGERVDARSDVFSAGAVFYELLTNRKPFDAESVHATLYQVVHRDPPPPRQWDPRLPEEVVTIIETSMNKQVASRYKNAAALRDAIRAFRYGEEPEVLEFEDASPEGEEAQPGAEATTVTTSAAAAPATPSSTGSVKVGSFRSYGRSSGASLPASAGVSSAPYTAGGRASRAGSRPTGRTGGDSPSASIPPQPRPTNPLLIVGVLALVVMVGIVGYAVVTRQDGGNTAQSSIDALTANLVETQLDLARRVLDDKDYKAAVDQTVRTLKLDPTNPEALAIREQAQGALREIETSVAAARDAVARGDQAQASAALERVMARDPNNPIVAELSSQLNANFAARATAAKSEMEKAKQLAVAKTGADQDEAFAEAERLAATAAKSLADRQFTTATQTYLQARDAFDRARRAVEAKERDAARAARDAAKAAATPAPVATTTPAVVPSATPLPTVVLRPIPTEPTQAPSTPQPTPAPTAAATPPPVAAGPVPESREFITARTRIVPVPTTGGKQPKGFDMSGVAIQEFSGRFEFEVLPSPLIPGAPYRVRIFLRNEGKNDAKLETLTVKMLRNGELSNPAARILEDDVKEGQRPLVAEIPGTWVAGTTAWVMDIESTSRKGERFRSSLTMKKP